MKSIRFAIAQMNPTVGDFSVNTKKILAWISRAQKHEADLVVFPECALSGYPVWDLANKRSFYETSLACLNKIAKFTKGKKISVVLGYIDAPKKKGEKSRNSLAWIHDGKVKTRYVKRLLPTYDVFLEEIFFASGDKPETVSYKGQKMGLSICEDIWDSRYTQKPLRDLKSLGSSLVLNISASPYYRGVAKSRDELLIRHAKKYRMPILYVNQVGGQDDLVFDGRSLLIDSRGKVLFRAPAFHEDLYYYDWDPSEKTSRGILLSMSSDRSEEMYDALVLGVRDYFRKNGFSKALIGLSGGIDSALVAAIACDALGAEAVMGIAMPGAYSSRESWIDAKDLAERFGMEFHIFSTKEKYDSLLKAYQQQKKKAGKKMSPKNKVTLAMENLQARIRGLELMYLSNDEGRLLLTTGNKSELAMGYCTLYGDMAGGLAVIGDVYKTDVYRLSHFRNRRSPVIPERIITKAPSAELRPNQKDEDSLPPYELLDAILYYYIEKNYSADEIIKHLKGKHANKVREVIRSVDHNEYKRRQTPPILRVTEKAWFGRRMPITNRFF